MPTYPSTGDKLIGKVKRALGELSGRPDLVIEGEAQDTGLPREDESPRKSSASPSRPPPRSDLG